MKESITSIIQWHTETFPDATLEDQKAKFEEELNEYNEDCTMLELADMFIVACGIARFDSITALEYFAKVNSKLRSWRRLGVQCAFSHVIDEKMEKNRKRTWKKQDNGAYHHTNKED